jgi:hypothetical protein
MLVVTALCAGLGLSGCANNNFDMDPSTWFPDGKKKLPGDRRDVFPEGVPGVTQGIPPEMIRGNPANQAAQDPSLAPQAAQPAPEPAPAPQAQEKPKPRPKKVARPRPASNPDADAQPAPRAAQPAPRQAQSESSGAWPAPQAQQQPQQQQAPAACAWPAPPAAGTFTR